MEKFTLEVRGICIKTPQMRAILETLGQKVNQYSTPAWGTLENWVLSEWAEEIINVAWGNAKRPTIIFLAEPKEDEHQNFLAASMDATKNSLIEEVVEYLQSAGWRVHTETSEDLVDIYVANDKFVRDYYDNGGMWGYE